MAPKKDKNNLSASNGSIVVGGNVVGSNIVVGNNNVVVNKRVNLEKLFKDIDEVVARKVSKLADREDIKAELDEIKLEIVKDKPDEGFLARRFRNIQRMSEDIAAVAIETLKNPVGGVVEVVRRVAHKMAEDAK